MEPTTMTQTRGEITITFGGEECVMRSSLSALMKLEERTGKSLVKLTQRFAAEDPPLSDVVAIIWAGLQAGGKKGKGDKPISFEEVGEVLLDEGFFKYLAPAANFLSMVLNGGKAAERTVEGKA